MDYGDEFQRILREIEQDQAQRSRVLTKIAEATLERQGKIVPGSGVNVYACQWLLNPPPFPCLRCMVEGVGLIVTWLPNAAARQKHFGGQHSAVLYSLCRDCSALCLQDAAEARAVEALIVQDLLVHRTIRGVE
jgi:hypothetical protein